MNCETTSSLLREQHAGAPFSSWPPALPSSPGQLPSPAASPSPLLSPQLRAPSGACTAPSPPSWPSPPLSWPPPGRPAQLLRPRAAFDWAASPAPTTVLEDPPGRREEDTPEGLEGLGLSERRREGVAPPPLGI